MHFHQNADLGNILENQLVKERKHEFLSGFQILHLNPNPPKELNP